MMKCPICGGDMSNVVITRLFGMDNVTAMNAHLCPGPITSNVNVTMKVAEFNEHLKNVRSWHAKFYYGRAPVPQVYQDAFKDGELDV